MSYIKRQNNIQGTVLKYIRIANETKLRELARKFDISPTYLCQVESGERKASDALLEKYCKEFDLNMDVLIYFDTEAKKGLHTQQILLMILKIICKKKYGDYSE